MANILDALGGGDIESARLATDARNRERRRLMAERIGKEQGTGAGIGAAFGTAFAGGLADKLLPGADSPEVASAKANKAILDEVAGLTTRKENPLVSGTPEFFAEQAEVLQRSGRTDLALQSLAAGQQARQKADSLARTQGFEDTREQRAVNADERAARAEERAIASAELAAKRFERDALGKGFAVGTTTGPELKSVTAALTENGVDTDFLNPGFGTDEEGFDMLNGRLAQFAKSSAKLRAERGEKVNFDQIVRDTVSDLLAQDFMEAKQNFGFGASTLTNDFDINKVDTYLANKLQTIAPTPAADETEVIKLF